MDKALIPVHQQQVEPPAHYPLEPNSSEYVDNTQSGSLMEYWRIVRRRKRTVILTTSCTVLAALLVTLAQTPVYQARTSIEIQDTKQDFTKQMSPVGDSGINALTDIQTQIQILQSKALAERTLVKLGVSSPNSPEGLISMLRRRLNVPKSASLQAREAILKACAKSLQVQVARQTRIVELFTDSTDAAVATAVANTLTSEYIDQNIEARWQMKQRTGDWLGQQLDEIRIKLERSEDALQSYARQNSLTFTSGQQNPSEQKLYQIQGQLSLATYDRVQSQSRYETARTATPETLSDIVDSGNTREPRSSSLLTYKAMLQMKVTDLQSQEAELTAIPKPDESKVKQVWAEIAALEQALTREQKAILERIRNAYQESLRREELLASDYASQVGLVNRDSEKSIRYNILKREVDSNRQIYEAMLQGVKESTVASALRASNVRIIDSAKLPEKPYRPSLAINCAIGLLSGLLLGIGYAVGREQGDRTIQGPGEASYFLRLPELGVIPSASVDKRMVFRGRKQRMSSSTSLPSPVSPMTAGREIKLSTPRAHLTTWQISPSMVGEGFRSVTASIMFAGHNGSQPHVLVITSAGPLEGKTTTASNLAIGFAKIGKKVLLIDGDLRKPSLHEIFETDNSSGFVDLLKQRQWDDSAAHTHIRETPVPNLHLLPSGCSVCAGADLDLLFSTSMPGLIACYKKEYDMVIIDTPPMLQVADARLLGRMSDAVVLVIRAGHTGLEAALAARERLAEDQTRVLGFILNDWSPSSSTCGYGFRSVNS